MNRLQQLAYDLNLEVIRGISGLDGDAAASWADDLVEETFTEEPHPLRLRIYLDEIERKAPPRARELREMIEAIRRVIA